MQDRQDNLSNLLDRLEDVQHRRGKDQYFARCPAHDDRSPSLSIKDANGTVLIHCFAGCDPSEILDAVGLEITDLFPPRDHINTTPHKPSWNSKDLLRIIAFEAKVILVAAGMMREEPLTEDDLDRLCLAERRLANALEVANVD